jgi:hypothetical protein
MSVKQKLLILAGVTVLAVSIACSSFGHSAYAAASPESSGMRTVTVTDPGNNMTAFAVEIPSNWKFAGTILRPGGCHAPAVPADGLSYAAVSPDGVTATMQLPGAAWDWSSDGSDPRGPKCKIVNINSAAGFLLNIAVPNIHPYSKVLGIVPLSPEMQQGVDARRRQLAAQATHNMRNTLDAISVRIEYDLNGQTVDEQLGTVVTCMETQFPAYPQMHRPARSQRACMSHGIYVKRALKGHLDELVGRKLPNARVDQQWDAYISQKMREFFAAYQKKSNEQFQAIQDHYRQVTAGMVKRGQEFNDNLAASTRSAMAADRATVNATSHMAHQQVLDSLNRQDFIDPTTGRKIETSNQYTHNWISSDKSEVVLGDDPTFDPNGVIDPVRQSWTELIPAN